MQIMEKENRENGRNSLFVYTDCMERVSERDSNDIGRYDGKRPSRCVTDAICVRSILRRKEEGEKRGDIRRRLVYGQRLST